MYVYTFLGVYNSPYINIRTCLHIHIHIYIYVCMIGALMIVSTEGIKARVSFISRYPIPYTNKNDTKTYRQTDRQTDRQTYR
jgi:hypothetical protein